MILVDLVNCLVKARHYRSALLREGFYPFQSIVAIMDDDDIEIIRHATRSPSIRAALIAAWKYFPGDSAAIIATAWAA